MVEGNDVAFVESTRISQKANIYDWEVLESFGTPDELAKISFSDTNQYINFCKDQNDDSILWWKDFLQQRRHAFVIAKGIMRGDKIEKMKQRQLEKATENSYAKKTYCLPIKEVYGLFSKTLN